MRPELARVIQFGVAYNAFVLVPNHGTKRRLWCLIELGGALLIHHGLTLRRGGFLERRTDDLVRLLGPVDIYLAAMTAAARLMFASKLSAVLS